MISGYDPETGICWQFRNKGDKGSLYCKCPACSGRYGERTLGWFGRCRSGARWFWAASAYFDGGKLFGWEDTEELATQAAMAAMRRLKTDLPMLASFIQQNASLTLKDLNEAKRAARPAPDTSDAHAVEYLYNKSGDKFQIIKKTRQRIYYSRQPLPVVERSDEYPNVRDSTDYGIGFIDRQEIERDAEIWSRKTGKWWGRDARLYLRPPVPKGQPEELPDLHALKAAMAAAHPDKGGSSAAFIAARAAYIAARRQLRERRP
jgi:hypothetical protein